MIEGENSSIREFRISVRSLVEFVERSGDLDDRRNSFDKDAMNKGSRLHRKLQRSRAKDYQSEVFLRETRTLESIRITVEGRADGVRVLSDDRVQIEEIKGMTAGLHRLEEPVPVHLAQAKCYAAIYTSQYPYRSAEICMTYGEFESEEIRQFTSCYTREELEEYFDKLLQKYGKWLMFRQSWEHTRDQSMSDLTFPFAYREGQRKIVSGVYHAISEKKQIFIQAPTGTGKTMSVLYPAIRTLGEGKADKIFYLTARTITRTVAQEAFQILKDRGLQIKFLVLTAKERLCPMEKTECNPEACPFAKGHFDRINDAVYEFLQQDISYDRESILRHAQKWQVCPFEMSLDAALWVDAVICDYNYVFDPDAYLKRFFGDSTEQPWLFLIDEAHNLTERGREMYSASLLRSHVLEARKKAKGSGKGLTRALNQLNRQLLELEKTEEPYEPLDNCGVFPISLLRVQGEMDKLRENPSNTALLTDLQDFYFEVRSFLNISELLDDNYIIYAEKGDAGKVILRLFCVNPSRNLASRLQKGSSGLFFSATLLPMPYYRSLLSTREDDFGLYLPSPFPRENRRILISRDVTTVYTRRGYEEYRKIAAYAAKMLNSRRGNYIIFFPSYQMMEEVAEIYEQEFSAPWVEVLRQTPQMTEQDREAFLQEFQREDRTLAAFCIMGGIFSEGIDLAGEKLIGTMVVGAGLPMLSNEREILKNYYDRKRNGQGFDYAYRIPGMNKVLQAAGRVIRTPSDRGVILLLDDRFMRREYRACMPPEWDDVRVCSTETVEKELRDFWRQT